MKKRDLKKAAWNFPWQHRGKIEAAVEKFEARVSGKRGAEEARDRFFAALENLYPKRPLAAYRTHKQRLADWKAKSAEALADLAGAFHDEHGYLPGDYLSTRGLDFVPPWESKAAPYCDGGGEGLGLVDITRTRVYAKSSKWRPSSVGTRFLVGRNEAGTYFSHPVSPNCSTVIEALQWIWNGRADRIIQRQGDVALIWGKGPKMPGLPSGHRIEGDCIVHETHPALPMPGKGQRIIVGRRAAERASEATRD